MADNVHHQQHLDHDIAELDELIAEMKQRRAASDFAGVYSILTVRCHIAIGQIAATANLLHFYRPDDEEDHANG